MKRKNDGIRQPVITPGEAWHLGRMEAVKELRLRLPRIDTHATEVLESIEDAAVIGYGKSAKHYPPQTLPPDFVFDSYLDMPVVVRPHEPVPGWGKIEFDPGQSGKPISLITPYRFVDVDSLPEGTRLVAITDPRHAALASVVDVLTCFRSALSFARVATGPDEASARIWDIVLVQLQAGRYATASLPPDEFHGWSNTRVQPGDPFGIPKLVADSAATARAQQALALEACAMWLDAANTVAGQRDDHFDTLQREVEDAWTVMSKLLESSNRMVVGEDWEHVDAMPVMRHARGRIPLLAIVPKDKSAEVVAKLLRQASE
ncbi:hypothetical protein [Luteimonas sp. MHLX1A]|uniref:hypothetical protein n=1 Tax=Alterluteimonas muca TaxID=2878684 RepID=UPI001E39EA53|nr:hypothetical protein [Luteimonas sp. MHLX1A]MCD9046724.1 hypothetical protein [Luteimonas sp. MHLX1A]